MKLEELLNTVQTVHRTYNTSEVFLCGGTVRDKYMGRLDNVDDLDFTTGDQTIKVVAAGLRDYLKNKYRVAYKMMDDGHSSIYLSNIKLDFSSNFILPDVEKHMQSYGVSKITPLSKEMYSRDFTCNSLLMDLSLDKIFSPVKGALQDLDNKIIKTCLSPEITLLNSRNRVARSIYLSAKLDFDIDPQIVQFVRENPESINVSTTNSLRKKLDEAFEKNPSRAVYNITKMNLWNYIPVTDLITPYYRKYSGATNA